MNQTLLPLDAAISAALTAALPDAVLTAPDIGYLSEPRGRYQGAAPLLARPRSVEEVATIVRLAGQHRIGIVPYAGGTGLVGGQIQDSGPPALLLSVERLNRIRSVDPVDSVMVAEAGVILADAQAAAEAVDRLFPLSLASEGSARIGGTLATNAGGVQVLRYGNARDLCLGIEAVMPDGSILRGLRALRKDNTGYDLRHLLIGSEGTLGIITAASLKLFPRPRSQFTALLAAASPGAALDVLNLVRDEVGESLTAFELIHVEGFRFLAEALPDAPQPFADPPEWAILLEAGSGAHAQLEERIMAALESAFERGMISDALIAQNRAQAHDFWQVRELIPEANRKIGSVSSHDISVPLSRVPDFIAEGAPAIAAVDPRLRINCFGHLGDGNLHYNVFPPKGGRREDHEEQRLQIKRAVHDLVHSMGGSISAEHGIGRLKRNDLSRYGDPTKIAAMRAIKAALDPLGIMNPGAVLPE